ncbi:MAG: TetR/AcrR family transcriptional regulator [Spirochaetaceae bacterium]|jgi:AcrR family transcriptional regulator|nr:TetR/AcrR family transcriptional regulator [Spirochaetaceae bacterium]
MGIVERKERERAKRKELIKKCAKELIFENGAASVSMADIAKEAELSKATLYLYFVNKEALFLEIFNESNNNFIERIYSKLNPSMSGLEGFKTVWGCYREVFGNSEDLIIMFSIWNYIAPTLPFVQIGEEAEADKNTSELFYTMITDMIKKGIDEGIFDPTINPQTVCRILMILFSSIVSSASKLPKAVRKSQFILNEIESMYEIILRGIAKESVNRDFFKFLQ